MSIAEMAHAPAYNDEAANTGENRTLQIFRGDGEGGSLVKYDVPLIEGMVVLDAIFKIQAEQAGDLAVRWIWKAGHCGS